MPIADSKGWAIVLFVLAAILAACQRPAANVTHSEPTRQVTDDLGRTVRIPLKITRVISTAPSVTENIFAAGAGDRLVGVTTFCDHPQDAKSIEKIGDTIAPNIERIVALKPDVVFVSSASQLENFTQTLADNGIAVYVSNLTSLDGVFENLKQLGEVFGTQEKVAQLLPDLKRRIGEVWRRVQDEPKVRVFVQISREPLFTVGRDSFVNNVMVKAGGESVTADVASAYPKLSKETAMALQPDAIILSESPDNQEPNEAFKNSAAVKNGRVYKIDADILSRPGPRLVDAIEQMARMLHPRAFGITEN